MDTWEYKPAKDAALPPLQRLRSEVREPGLTSHVISTVSWTVLSPAPAWWSALLAGPEVEPISVPGVVTGKPPPASMCRR